VKTFEDPQLPNKKQRDKETKSGSSRDMFISRLSHYIRRHVWYWNRQIHVQLCKSTPS